MVTLGETNPTSLGDEEVTRAFYLLRAWKNQEPTLVGGVYLKLDCDCDKEQWQPLCPIGLYGDLSAIYGPELVFPWTPDYVKESLGRHESLIEVTEGCTVVINSVTSSLLAPTFNDFAPSNQREGKLAHLTVIRPNGDAVKVKRPLFLLRASAIDTFLIAGNYGAAFRGLVDQLGDQVGLHNIQDIIDEPVENWPKPKDEIDPIYKRAFFAFVEGQNASDCEAYVAFGYLMAKAEAAGQLLPSATKGRQAADIQARAAGERRSKSRQATEKLRSLAKNIIREDPDISLGKCSKIVNDIVSSDPDWKYTSDDKWVKRHIKELFERRSNGVEYRPKRSS